MTKLSAILLFLISNPCWAAPSFPRGDFGSADLSLIKKVSDKTKAKGKKMKKAHDQKTQALEALKRPIKTSEDFLAAVNAVEPSMAWISDPAVKQALFGKLLDNKIYKRRYGGVIGAFLADHISVFLRPLVSTDSEVKEVYLQMLTSNNSKQRSYALMAFGLSHLIEDKTVRNGALNCLYDPDPYVRTLTIEFFGAYVDQDLLARNSIRYHLMEESDEDALKATVRVLSRLVKRDPAVRSALAAKLAVHPMPEIVDALAE